MAHGERILRNYKGKGASSQATSPAMKACFITTSTLMHTSLSALSALCLFLVAVPATRAQAPQTLSYQGFLTDNGGTPLNTSATLTFTLWTHPTSTNPAYQAWTETHAGVPVADGLYNVSLGSNTSFASQGVAFDQAYWLEITVDDGSGPVTLAPRTALEAVPYAFHAMNAGSAGSAWALTGNGGTTPGTNFLGTTDNTAFEVKVNGVRALRLEPTAGGPNVVAGAASNAVTAGAVNATIGGGQDNSASGDLAVIGGGDTNAAGEGATVGGGQGNDASGSGSTVGGGAANRVTGLFGTIGGGGPINLNDPLNTRNRVTDDYGTIGGGGNNQAGDDAGTTQDAPYATVGGGRFNTASNDDTTIGGGVYNSATTDGATVGGGSGNTTSGYYATIGGGNSNYTEGYAATISGGEQNTAFGALGTVVVGNLNHAYGDYGTVAGGNGNTVTGDSFAGTIGGGTAHYVSGDYATIAGGRWNRIEAPLGTIAGGGYSDPSDRNYVTDEGGTIGGGGSNYVGNGSQNTTDAYYATISGGWDNTASNKYVAIGGGHENVADGQVATIPGGWLNTAAGDYSFAAGCQAQANHDGAFVWADSRTCTAFASERDYQFRVRAWGGLRVDDEVGNWIDMIWDQPINTSTGAYLSWGGAWTNTSDVALKENFQPIDPAAVLDEVIRLPVETWRYKAEAPETPHKTEVSEARHLGPTAQDFYAAFGLGASEKTISTIDADGVALAAIQGIYALLMEKDAQIEALQRRLDDLQAQVATLRQER